LAKRWERGSSFSSRTTRGFIDHIQRARHDADALIINPAGFSFTSVAIVDALKIFKGPIIEVHISNIHARDKLHSQSIVSTAARSVICGLGPFGYVAAVQSALLMLGKLPKAFNAGLLGPA
jgi:3-dehydroquinate dehydratase II